MMRVVFLLCALLLLFSCNKDEDIAAPIVTITNPVEGATITGSTTISATVVASGTIEGVAFVVDGERTGDDNSEPFEYEWFIFPWADGEVHSITVTASDLAGRFGRSDPVNVTVAEDQINLTATPTPGGIRLSWDDKEGALSYNVYWSLSPGVTVSNGTKIPNASNPFTRFGLTAGTTYYYIVTAEFPSGETKPSNEVSVAPG